jgi:hypothetical protein
MTLDRLQAAWRLPVRLLQMTSVTGREVSLRLLRAVWRGAGPLENLLRELSRLEFNPMHPPPGGLIVNPSPHGSNQRHLQPAADDKQAALVNLGRHLGLFADKAPARGQGKGQHPRCPRQSSPRIGSPP